MMVNVEIIQKSSFKKLKKKENKSTHMIILLSHIYEKSKLANISIITRIGRCYITYTLN